MVLKGDNGYNFTMDSAVDTDEKWLNYFRSIWMHLIFLIRIAIMKKKQKQILLEWIKKSNYLVQKYCKRCEVNLKMKFGCIHSRMRNIKYKTISFKIACGKYSVGVLSLQIHRYELYNNLQLYWTSLRSPSGKGKEKHKEKITSDNLHRRKI